MEPLTFSLGSQGLEIQGFPDAVKAIRIDGHKAQRLADLTLHHADLDFAWNCLESINGTPPEPRVVRQALWRGALVHFFKCFKNSKARGKLKKDEIWLGNVPALEAFAFFESLRDKHVVHDENSWMQSKPGAILNKPDKTPKIAKIFCLGIVIESLDQGFYDPFHTLVSTANKWVTNEIDLLCDELTQELEAESYEELANRPAVDFQLAKSEDIGKNRS